MFTEPIITFLGIFNGFAYGLLFLYLDEIIDVFVENKRFLHVGTDVPYLNFVVGVYIMFVFGRMYCISWAWPRRFPVFYLLNGLLERL